ncbi:hypothetical protein JQ634_16955 [Bradyrhizobium sp. AUGA SZCCT0240]|uniref:hypothetical protein n=1 Tax=unclassified Bradyrhizobium TaxID=2631580 RepID=UPI001BAAAF7B|nr:MULTISPECIES: hypothetical protein [unclassified Bradyrhizobium]MBR1187618.1 hypothetical protein [Bradyrhizobium sp. AUGA SZCCT0160]MBR1199865.1 hypothetical protein [Bradyrhizobium sp. AUGA SZCCT0158]MBR1239097.1 hypothetical protein [Bradyrhizobium sp. AUGA SZCCT0274]MBR1255387.1 hypothetical protein [Bradyrhizobium sp. AUGA SZCCT0240]
MNAGLLALSTVKPFNGMAALRGLAVISRTATRVDELSLRNGVLKRKDPSGGTTGRVKPYGRLGWMGARAEYSRWGGITAPTFISRSSFAGRSKGRSIFLTFYSGEPAEITA